MSARVESAPIRGSYTGTIAVAIFVALGVGALMGTVVTKAMDDRPAAAVAPAAGTQLWDAQKLEAMEGRALAERYRVEQPVTWDQQKLDAMAGRVIFEPVIQGWDAYKLEAMKGRVLAEQVRAEDPPVKPHLPKRPPVG